MGLLDQFKTWGQNIIGDIQNGGLDKLETLDTPDGIVQELESTEPGKYSPTTNSDDDSQDDADNGTSPDEEPDGYEDSDDSDSDN